MANDGVVKSELEQKGNIIKVAILTYLTGIAFFIACFLLDSWLHIGLLAFFGYFIVGFVLNHKVLKQMEWHPVYNTLQNVASAKLSYFLFWPFSYPKLIFKLLVVKVL